MNGAGLAHPSPLLTVAEIVAAQARLQPDRLGARDSQRALSFRQWDARADRLANALLGLGLGKGDRVAVLAYNCVEWMEIYVALARAGLVAVPINFRLLGAEIEYIVRHCEARAFIVQDDLLDRVLPVRDGLDIESSCFIHFGGASVPSGWQSYEALIERAAGAQAGDRGRTRRHVGADVHVRHDGPTQGRDAQSRRQRADLARHCARHGLLARQHGAARDADVPRQLAVLLVHVHVSRRIVRDLRSQELRPGTPAAHAVHREGHVHLARSHALHHDACASRGDQAPLRRRPDRQAA